jgi:hypothetical protein
MACAGLIGAIACGGERFQSAEDSAGSSGAMGGGGKGSGSGGASNGGASSGGALGKGGTLGVSGGSSTGGSGGGPSTGGVPPGGGPSGGAGNEGGSTSGTGGFNVAGVGAIGGGTSVSCATDPDCFNCCRETIGNGAFVGLVSGCSCSAPCYDVCFGFCEQGSGLEESCEFCIVSEFENGVSNMACAQGREQCNSNLECTKYVNCLSSCEP